MWKTWTHEKALSRSCEKCENARPLPKMQKRKTSCQSMSLQNKCRRKPFTASGKLEKECGMPTHNDTSGGEDSTSDSTGNTAIGESQSDFISQTICNFPSDPDLLPPGAQCKLANSKLVCFVNEDQAVIPTGVTGASWKRQDFLIF